MALVPLAIDELPVLFIAAAMLKETLVTGAAELRVKEAIDCRHERRLDGFGRGAQQR